MNDLTIRPDFVLRAVLLDKNGKVLQLPNKIPRRTTFLSTSAPGIFGQLDRNIASLEDKSDENAHSFLCLQYTEKFQFSFFRNDKAFGLPSEDNLNNYCDRDISNFIDPFIVVFLFPRAITGRLLNVVRQTFLRRTFSVVGGIALSLGSLVNEKREDRSLDGKIAGLIFDGNNIEYEVFVQYLHDEDKLLSAFQKLKVNMLKKTKSGKLELKRCFMLMITHTKENVECKIIDKVFPGLHVFGVVNNHWHAFYATEKIPDKSVWNHASVFCFIALKDESF